MRHWPVWHRRSCKCPGAMPPHPTPAKPCGACTQSRPAWGGAPGCPADKFCSPPLAPIRVWNLGPPAGFWHGSCGSPRRPQGAPVQTGVLRCNGRAAGFQLIPNPPPAHWHAARCAPPGLRGPCDSLIAGFTNYTLTTLGTLNSQILTRRARMSFLPPLPALCDFACNCGA